MLYKYISMQTHAFMRIATCRDVPKLQYTYVNTPSFPSSVKSYSHDNDRNM